MKKSTNLLALAVLSSLSLAACEINVTVEAPFEVGEDTATYEVEGHSEWAGSASAFVKIVAGEDVLFNGTVQVTSDTLYASEFFKAACLEKSLNQNGLENGFVTNIGSYENNNDTFTYWMWQYNGHNPTNFSCNDVHVFDGDYLLYSYEVATW